MLNLEGFSIRDLQNCLHLLTAAEADGITDARFLRARLSEVIERDRQTRSKTKRQNKLATAKLPMPRTTNCPSCGKMAVVESVVDGQRIGTCLTCRWSEYRGEVR